MNVLRSNRFVKQVGYLKYSILFASLLSLSDTQMNKLICSWSVNPELSLYNNLE